MEKRIVTGVKKCYTITDIDYILAAYFFIFRRLFESAKFYLQKTGRFYTLENKKSEANDGSSIFASDFIMLANDSYINFKLLYSIIGAP